MLYHNRHFLNRLRYLVRRLFSRHSRQIRPVILEYLVALSHSRIVGQRALLHVMYVNTDRIAAHQTDAQIGVLLGGHCDQTWIALVKSCAGVWRTRLTEVRRGLILQAVGKLLILNSSRRRRQERTVRGGRLLGSWHCGLVDLQAAHENGAGSARTVSWCGRSGSADNVVFGRARWSGVAIEF